MRDFFCYKLATAILGDKVRGAWRDVTVRVPKRFPARQTWQQELVEKIATIKNGGSVQVADGAYARSLCVWLQTICLWFSRKILNTSACLRRNPTGASPL
ncbi:MAG: hypothetical protein ACREQN_14860 [Candidatus Binataceae bacterium]